MRQITIGFDNNSEQVYSTTESKMLTINKDGLLEIKEDCRVLLVNWNRALWAEVKYVTE